MQVMQYIFFSIASSCSCRLTSHVRVVLQLKHSFDIEIELEARA